MIELLSRVIIILLVVMIIIPFDDIIVWRPPLRISASLLRNLSGWS
jgi:hypothetical protein